MDDDEEIRSQCFGGDYPTQSFDQPLMKRYDSHTHEIKLNSCSRQRRWWNAYILFYEKLSNDPSETTSNLEQDLARLQLCRFAHGSRSISISLVVDDQTQRMPLSVQRSVRKQNVKFLHNRIHFSPEYFHFMKRLVQSNAQVIVNFFQPQAQHAEKLVSGNVILIDCISSPSNFLSRRRSRRSKNSHW